MLFVRISSGERLVVSLLRRGACEAESMPFAHQKTIVVDSFSALVAGHALSLVAGKFPGSKRYPHPLLLEKVMVAHLTICGHLLQVFVVYLRMKFARLRLRRFPGSNADRAMSFDIHKGRCHLAPVAKLERALAQPASGDDANGIGSATIDFDEGDQALAITSPWLLQAEAAAPEHCQTDTQNLPSAEMSVGNPGFLEKIIERGQGFRHALMLDQR
jgi:hypothetical protein